MNKLCRVWFSKKRKGETEAESSLKCYRKRMPPWITLLFSFLSESVSLISLGWIKKLGERLKGENTFLKNERRMLSMLFRNRWCSTLAGLRMRTMRKKGKKWNSRVVPILQAGFHGCKLGIIFFIRSMKVKCEATEQPLAQVRQRRQMLAGVERSYLRLKVGGAVATGRPGGVPFTTSGEGEWASLHDHWLH